MDNNYIVLTIILILLLIFVCYNKNNNENFGKSKDYKKYYNKSIGKTGNFYVNCSKCNDKVNEKYNHYSLLDNKNNYDNRFNNFYVNRVLKNNIPKQLSLPDPNKINPINNIDTNHIFCYNCLLDNKIKEKLKDSDNFPHVNGPPHTNISY